MRPDRSCNHADQLNVIRPGGFFFVVSEALEVPQPAFEKRMFLERTLGQVRLLRQRHLRAEDSDGFWNGEAVPCGMGVMGILYFLDPDRNHCTNFVLCGASAWGSCSRHA